MRNHLLNAYGVRHGASISSLTDTINKIVLNIFKLLNSDTVQVTAKYSSKHQEIDICEIF